MATVIILGCRNTKALIRLLLQEHCCLSRLICLKFKSYYPGTLANNADPDQALNNATSHQGLMTLKKKTLDNPKFWNWLISLIKMEIELNNIKRKALTYLSQNVIFYKLTLPFYCYSWQLSSSCSIICCYFLEVYILQTIWTQIRSSLIGVHMIKISQKFICHKKQRFSGQKFMNRIMVIDTLILFIFVFCCSVAMLKLRFCLL